MYAERFTVTCSDGGILNMTGSVIVFSHSIAPIELDLEFVLLPVVFVELVPSEQDSSRFP